MKADIESDNYESEPDEEEMLPVKNSRKSPSTQETTKRGKASKGGQNDKEARKAARMLRNRR